MPVEIASVLAKMAMLVLLMLVGYLCARLRVTGPEFNRRATPVVMNVLLPATILNSVIGSEEPVSGTVLLGYLGVLFLALLLCFVAAWLAVWLLRARGDERGVLWLTMAFSNNAFVGFPVVEVVFGPAAVFYAAISNIPFNLMLYTVGTAQLQQGEGRRMNWKQVLSTPLVATLLAAVLFLTRVPVPQVLCDTISTLAAATIPMSMLIVGTSLGGIPVKKAFGSARVYLAAAVRLLAAPVLVWLVLRLFVRDPVMLGIPVIIAACPSAMIITVLCLRYGRDDSLSSEVIFVSTVFSAVTIPLLLWLLF